MGRRLLFSVTKDDFRIDTFRAGGKGGQKQNKTNSGVRITHIESGAVGEARDSRSQHENRRRAFRRCVDSKTFKLWSDKKAARMMVDEAEVERKVNIAMRDSNIKTEVMIDGSWTEVKEDD